jgi:hypothetical protein
MFTFTIRSEWKWMISLSIFGGIPNFSVNNPLYSEHSEQSFVRDTVKSFDKVNENSPSTESMFMQFLNCHLDSKDSITAAPLLHEAILFFEAFWL